AETVEDGELRTIFQNAVMRSWAQFDATSLVDYAMALDPEAQQRLGVMSGLYDVARLDPERALALAPRPPAAPRAALERTPIDAPARRDPEAALERLRALPAGQQQQFASQQTIARAYGRKDPDAALAWARSKGDRESLIGVLSGIATTDPNRAIDLAPT